MHMRHSMKNLIIAGIVVGCAVVLNMGIVNTWPPILISLMPTTSMEPDINAGDIFTVDRTVPFHSVNIDDVAVYWRDYDRIAHGVVNNTTDEIVTKGHNPPWGETDRVSRDQYIGIVKDVYEIWILNVLFDHVPIDNLMQFPNKVILLIIIGIVLFLFLFLYRHYKQRVSAWFCLTVSNCRRVFIPFWQRLPQKQQSRQQSSDYR